MADQVQKQPLELVVGSRQLQSKLAELQQARSANSKTADLLKCLPEKGRHQIMVSEGEAAFFQGQLLHTNKCQVHMGEVPPCALVFH